MENKYLKNFFYFFCIFSNYIVLLVKEVFNLSKKEVKTLESNETITIKQFDAYIKKVLVNELKDKIKSRKNRAKHTVNFAELTKSERDKLISEDVYGFDLFQETITTALFDATIHDELLHRALMELKQCNREIILMKYWGDLTDTEIGLALSMSQQMVNYYRNRSLKLLKNIIEEMRKND